MKKATVNSSNGELVINADTGVVLVAESRYDNNELRDIVKFDMDEYKEFWGKLDDSYDILDLGYWVSGDGTYEEPANDWRTDTIRRQIAGFLFDLTAMGIGEDGPVSGADCVDVVNEHLETLRGIARE